MVHPVAVSLKPSKVRVLASIAVAFKYYALYFVLVTYT